MHTSPRAAERSMLTVDIALAFRTSKLQRPPRFSKRLGNIPGCARLVLVHDTRVRETRMQVSVEHVPR